VRKTAQSILAIEKDSRTSKIIREGLAPYGYLVHSAGRTSGGLKSFLNIRPDFVILSVSPRSRGCMTTLRDICEADPRAQVIAISSCSDEAYAMECIRQGAVDYLKKPVQVKDLTRSIDRINYRRRLLKIISEPDVECVKAEDKLLVFGNNMESLPCIINQAVCNARVVCKDMDMLKTALGEMLINAIEHGNLAITGEEKSTAIEKGKYEKLLKDRSNDARYASRVVRLRVHMTRDELRYIITDQGDGFDYTRIYDSDPHTRVGSGLGLFIARSFFTGITYKRKGNQVVLVYRRP